MKKFFMIAAIAALGLGAYSCENSPGNGGGTVGDGEKSGFSLSITMPEGTTGTRASDFGDIAARDEENQINTVDVYLFNANGTAAGEGHHSHVLFSTGPGGTFERVGSTNEYRMLKEIPATAGTNMRVWVGINLPRDTDEATALMGDDATTYDDEEDMLLEIQKVVDMDDDNNFLMFSNVSTKTLLPIPVGETFWQQNPGDDASAWTFNVVDVDVFRVVSKVVATDETSLTGTNGRTIDWSTSSANPSDLTLVYNITHWWVFQWAKDSWVAPRYVVDDTDYLNSSDLPRPWTYPVGTPAAISTYDEDAVIANKLTITVGTQTDGELTALTGAKSKFIGENARFGGSEATNGLTTQAFISTGVVADYEVVWDTATKAIKWQPAVAQYGAVASPNSVWLIKHDGHDYITSSKDNVSKIAGGLAALEGLYPVDNQSDIDNPDPDKAGTPMLVDDLYEAIDLQAYEYQKGFVHFLVWINNIKDQGNKVNNQYEILRNQFIHLKVTGMGNLAGTFPGYPGKDGEPEIPIDPTDPDNPYPLIPTDPVDPDPTKMLVNVEIRDWTYRENDVILQR